MIDEGSRHNLKRERGVEGYVILSQMQLDMMGALLSAVERSSSLGVVRCMCHLRVSLVASRSSSSATGSSQ